jgi:hypothetical protein
MRDFLADHYLTAGLWAAYTVVAAVVVIWSALLVISGYDSLLANALSQPWVALGLYAPVLLGLIVQLIGRRFWAWPYVYLLVLAMGVACTSEDIGDQMYAYGGSAVLVLTVFVAESVGLAFGRWLHRYAGAAFFVGAGCWMFIEGLRVREPAPIGRWQSWTLVLAGSLFLIHAAIQAGRYLSRQRAIQQELLELAGQAAEAQEKPALPAPPPTLGAEHEPWHIKPWDEALKSADAEVSQGDNNRDE